MNKLILAFRDISNYFFILRKIRKAKNSEKWLSLNLNVDWIGRIWTIINLRNEDLGEDELVKKARVVEKIKPINSYLLELGLSEIVFPAIEQKTPRSYLLVYSPLFSVITLWRFLSFTIIMGLLIYFGYKFLIFKNV